MDINAELAPAHQAFRKLINMCRPAQVQTWKPDETQKAEYIRLIETVVNAMDNLVAHEARQLLSEGKVQSFIPEELLAFIRGTIKPEEPALRQTLDLLDPEGKILREFLAGIGRPCGIGNKVLSTFEQGIQEVAGLIDRNPDKDFFPDIAYEVLDSKLIAFDPDSWLDRAGELAPVRTNNKNLVLPGHVRLRLEELYRTYVFGCWLSVLSLTRAVLEYALLDNANKFSIDTYWPPDANGKKREKKLSHLIEDFSPHLPTITNQMNRLRDIGNDYLHPKTSQMSKEKLFARQAVACEAISLLVEAVETIYHARK